jgi:hypothetical protein
MVRIGALTWDDHAKRRDEKKKNRDLLDEIGGEWARGRPKRLEGGSQRQGESTKTHGRHSSGQGLILSGVRIPCQTLATFFFADPLDSVMNISSRPCCTSEYTGENPFGTRAAKFRTSIDSWPWARFLISPSGLRPDNDVLYIIWIVTT